MSLMMGSRDGKRKERRKERLRRKCKDERQEEEEFLFMTNYLTRSQKRDPPDTLSGPTVGGRNAGSE